MRLQRCVGTLVHKKRSSNSSDLKKWIMTMVNENRAPTPRTLLVNLQLGQSESIALTIVTGYCLINICMPIWLPRSLELLQFSIFLPS